MNQVYMRSRPNWYQIGRKTCYIPKVSKFSEEKGYRGNRLESVIFAMERGIYRIKDNVKREDHVELNFEGLEMQK